MVSWAKLLKIRPNFHSIVTSEFASFFSPDIWRFFRQKLNIHIHMYTCYNIMWEKCKNKNETTESEDVTEALRVGGLVVVFINGGINVTLITEKLDCRSGIEPQYSNIINIHYKRSHASHMTESRITWRDVYLMLVSCCPCCPSVLISSCMLIPWSNKQLDMVFSTCVCMCVCEDGGTFFTQIGQWRNSKHTILRITAVRYMCM